MDRPQQSLDLKKPNDSCQSFNPSQNILPHKQDSPYFDQVILIDSQIQRMLLSSKRFYKKEKWAKDILETCINTDFQSTTVQLHYGFYATQINFINIEYQVSQKDYSQAFIGSGQYGKVYVYRSEDGSDFAVKMIKFDKEQFFSGLKNVYREYFIGLLASQLAVGPRIINMYGYQLLFLSNYALFGMQLGQRIGYENQSIQFYRQVELSLQNSLKILHSLHVVHRDIKPGNILWSNCYKKYVFIDFGLSLIVQQSPGQKTQTFFTGTFNFCGPDMRKLYYLGQSGKVDLYNNDMFSVMEVGKLIGTYFDIKNMNKRKDEEVNLISQLFLVSKIKWAIFDKQFRQAHFLLQKIGMHKTALFIADKGVQGQLIPEEMMDRWNQLRKHLQQKIKGQKNFSQKNDEIVVQVLAQNSLHSVWSHLLLSLKHFQNFLQWSNNQMWLQRVFLVLNPVADLGLTQQQREKRSVQIIDKIYTTLQFPQTTILFQKFRSVFLFFFEKFKKFNSKKVLEPLSEAFSLINDNLSLQQVKELILQTTQDPIQFCLKCLKYHLQEKKFFGYTSVSYIYLGKLRYKLRELKNSRDQIVRILEEIVERMQKVDLVLLSNFDILEEIQILMLRLQGQVSKYKPEFEKITENFDAFYNFFCYCFMVELNNLNNYKRVKLLDQPKKKLRRLYLKHKDYFKIIFKSITNINKKFYFDFYQHIFYQSANIKNRKRYVQFLLQLSRGEPYFIQLEQWNNLEKYFAFTEAKFYPTLKHCQQISQNNKMINIMVMKRCSQWIKNYKQQPLLLGYFNTISLKIIYVASSFYSVMFNENNSIKYPEDHEYCHEFGIFLQEMRLIAHRELLNQEQKKLVLLIVRIGQLGRIMSSQYDQLQLSNNLFHTLTQIIESDFPPQLWKISECVLNLFHMALILIISNSLIKNPEYLEEVQKKFQFFFYFTQHIRIFMFGVFFAQLIRIRHKRYSEQDNLSYILQVIQFVSIEESLNQKKNVEKNNFCMTLSYFVQLSSPQFVRSFLTQLTSKHQHQNLIKLTSNCYSSFILFEMCFKLQTDEHMFRKYFSKIVLNFDDFHQYVRVHIKSRFLVFFIQSLSLSQRKIAIYLRKLCQNTAEDGTVEKSWAEIRKMIERKSLKWPPIIHRAIKQKISLEDFN